MKREKKPHMKRTGKPVGEWAWAESIIFAGTWDCRKPQRGAGGGLDVWVHCLDEL
jgi:hypothetical protein